MSDSGHGGMQPYALLNKPKVSIIIVTRNAGDCLEKAIQSVLGQSFPHLELIIIDGASTDGTLDIIRKYEEKIAFWKSEPDNGVYDAMNKAVKHAKGDWVFFMGADDQLFPGFSELAAFMNDPRRIYHGCSIWANHVMGFIYSAYRLAKENIPHQSLFYPRSVFGDFSYTVKYRVRADYVLNMQLWASKKYRFEYLGILVSRYASGGFSSRIIDETFNKDKVRLVGKYLGIIVMFRYMLKRYKYKQKNYIEY